MPKYSVHLNGNGSTGYARDYITCDTLAGVRAELAIFHRRNDGTTGPDGDEAAWADVYAFDPRDNSSESYGDYPSARYVIGPRGGISREF